MSGGGIVSVGVKLLSIGSELPQVGVDSWSVDQVLETTTDDEAGSSMEVFGDNASRVAVDGGNGLGISVDGGGAVDQVQQHCSFN